MSYNIKTKEKMSSPESEPLLQKNTTAKMSTSIPKQAVKLTLNEEMPNENGLKSGQENEAVEETGQTLPQVAGRSTYSVNAGSIRVMFKQILYSGKLLKFFASMFGLWPIKRKAQLTIFTIFVVISLFAFVYVIHRIYYNFDISHQKIKLFSSTSSFLYMAWYIILPISCLISYLLMFHYSVIGGRKEQVFSIPSACLKTGNTEWLILNVQLIFSCCISLTYLGMSNIKICTGCTVLLHASHLALFISALGMLLACFVFVALACALHTSASECHIAICSLNEGSLDDVINIHQDLCDRVFATCKALQPWFVTHWMLLAAGSVTTILRCVYVDLSHDPNFSFPIILVLYLFLLPSLYAARVTRKCQKIIIEVNNSRPRDWGDKHPFRKRKNLNCFVSYANG